MHLGQLYNMLRRYACDVRPHLSTLFRDDSESYFSLVEPNPCNGAKRCERGDEFFNDYQRKAHFPAMYSADLRMSEYSVYVL